MPARHLGHFIRERRQDLGLTQEQLGARIGDGLPQAEVSRLERGVVAFPRRSRLEALAIALEVSVGRLFIETGLLEPDEADQVDLSPRPQTTSYSPEEMLADVTQLRDALVAAIGRIQALSDMVATAISSVGQRDDAAFAGMGECWDSSATPEA